MSRHALFACLPSLLCLVLSGCTESSPHAQENGSPHSMCVNRVEWSTYLKCLDGVAYVEVFGNRAPAITPKLRFIGGIVSATPCSCAGEMYVEGAR